jgi:hypothetical protein
VLFLATVIYSSKTSSAWGTASDSTFREANFSSQETLPNAWIANAAQLVLSFCYLAINCECTAMASAAEWNNLASSRKGLRVTRSVGQQRDTYFLQLPYCWSLLPRLQVEVCTGYSHSLFSSCELTYTIGTAISSTTNARNRLVASQVQVSLS